jgi:hypothetical protein
MGRTLRSVPVWLALALAAFPACRGGGKRAPSVSFERVAIIGASVSAGFGGAPFAEVVDGAVEGDHEVLNAADTFLFRDPINKGREQVDSVLEFRPTAVLALDSLFWCVYTGAGEARRAEGLEMCLAELARIEAVVFVGDVPDMRRAATWMLPHEVVPPPEQLERFNRRIAEWVDARPQRRLVPMAAWGKPLLGDDPEMRMLMSLDGLHPNRDGVVYMLRKLAAEVEGGEALSEL